VNISAHLSLAVVFCPFASSCLSNVLAMQSCRHHQHGRWQARIGRVAGNKDLYLGTFSKYIHSARVRADHKFPSCTNSSMLHE
jgi:hypothetical protein